MRLRLVQLPPLPSYQLATAVQDVVRRQFLHAKDSEAQFRRRREAAELTSTSSSSPSSHDTLLSLLVQPPPPTIIAFTPQPTFTLGRRQETSQLTQEQIDRLTAPLSVPSSQTQYTPALISTLRGGLTTYHGPGQAVLWPIIDLKSPLFANNDRPPLTVRVYSRLLETTTAEVLKRRFGLEAYTTGDPGLWVQSPRRDGSGTEERKIAALGVHLRRNISALGVAVNLDTPVTWGPEGRHADKSLSEERNPWTRFTPCGIEGKGVSCVADEGRLRFGRSNGNGNGGGLPASWDLRPEPFAAKWAAAFAIQLGLRDPDVDVVDSATVARMIVDAEELMHARRNHNTDRGESLAFLSNNESR
ncbi:hypothetical protein SEUCBS139899_003633 [Sporothrix eucalyptigena]|uniref:BPL/LPL catalytic domain-containing protein n=1 Tax=Sporothrix eucalyptigena TaxID=1812306 RepID=A0ABP0C8Q6_9PEZI